MATEEQMQQLADESVAILNDPMAEVGRLNLEVARLEGELVGYKNDLQNVREMLGEAKATIRAKDAALQMWDDFDNIPGREFDEKYPWLAGTNYDFQERLMYAFTRAALDTLRGVE